MKNENILDISQFSLQYDSVEALRNVSFSVGKGEIVGVVGQSGCGKSSLVNSILRLLPNVAQTQGEILFNRQNLYDNTELAMRRLRGVDISVIFQDPLRALNPVLSIGKQMTDIQYRDNISRAEKQKNAVDMLRQVEIPEPELKLKQYPNQLSGGMLQRVAIAMALMLRPQLLIADEPTTALDATLEVQIIQIIKQLQHNYGCSVLLISHHLGLISEMCQKVAVMYAGEVVEFGHLPDVFVNPRHPYTRRMLECDPARIKHTMRRLPTIAGDIPDLSNLPTGCAFAPRCDSMLPQCTLKPPPMCDGERGHKVSCWLSEAKNERVTAS